MWLARNMFSTLLHFTTVFLHFTTQASPEQYMQHESPLAFLSHFLTYLGIHPGDVQCSTKTLSYLVHYLVQGSSFHTQMRRCVQCAVLGARSKRWPRCCAGHVVYKGSSPWSPWISSWAAVTKVVYEQSSKEESNLGWLVFSIFSSNGVMRHFIS